MMFELLGLQAYYGIGKEY